MITWGFWEIFGCVFIGFAFLAGLVAVIRERMRKPREGNPVEFNPGEDRDIIDHQRSRR